MRKTNKKIKKRIATFILVLLIFLIFLVMTLVFNIIDRELSQSIFLYGQSVGALIAAFLVVNELKRDADAEEYDSKIQQSTFIKDYNQAFITNPDMMFIERALEEYYSAFRNFVDNVDNNRAPTTEELKTEEEKLKALFNVPGTVCRQRLINYLVYLEGLATVISNGAMKIDNVDSLLGYRFFIAVNNPIVQKLELNQYPNDYRGIHALGQDWVDHRSKIYKKLSKEEQNKLSKEAKYGNCLIPMQKDGFSFKQESVKC